MYICASISVFQYFSFFLLFKNTLSLDPPTFPWTAELSPGNCTTLQNFAVSTNSSTYKTFLNVNIVLENEILLAFMCALYLLNILLALMCTMYLLEHVQNLLEYAAELYYTRHTCIM